MDGERNLTDAESYLERSLVLYRDLGYQPGIATVLRNMKGLRIKQLCSIAAGRWRHPFCRVRKSVVHG